MTRLLVFSVVVLLARPGWAADDEPPGLLFREAFDDADLEARGWYDTSRTRIVGDAKGGSAASSTNGSRPTPAVRGDPW